MRDSTKFRSLLSMLLGIGMMTFGVNAMAQDEPVDPDKKEEPVTPPEAESDEVASFGKAPFPRVSDDEETIYAVQRKAFLVNKKIELTPMFAAAFTDRFVQTFAPAGSVTYHLAENFGIEVYGAYMFPNESGLTDEILEKGKLTPEIAKLTQQLWAAGLGVQWSPIYGKIQILGSTLGNFQFYVGAGAGVGQTRVQCTPGTELDPNRGFSDTVCPDIPDDEVGTGDSFPVVYEPATLKFIGAFSGGVRFYFSNTVGLKFEVKDYVFTSRVFRPKTSEPTQQFTDAIRNNIYAQIGVSFLFLGEEN